MSTITLDPVLQGPSGERQSIIDSFEVFRQELDAYNDRRDRLIKLSRDVTNHSKKIIFLLHRTATCEVTNEHSAIASAVRQSHEKLSQVRAIFEQMQGDLQGENFWRLQKTVSGGIQEYIEALSFTHYLEHKSLITFLQVQENLTARDGTPFFPLGLTCADYLLGVSDLTGELMRFAITSIGRKGLMSKANFDKATEVSAFVRACRSAFEPMIPYVKELKSKQSVTTHSLKKIEEAAYSVAIRGIERATLNDFVYMPLPRTEDTEDALAEKDDD